MIARKIAALFPLHKLYVEPFGGAASVLMAKAPAPLGEVYNDLDFLLVNYIQTLRDLGRCQRLMEAISATPYDEESFDKARNINCEGEDGFRDRGVEMARRLAVRSFMGYSGDGITRNRATGFRKDSSSRKPSDDWRTYPSYLPVFGRRLLGVSVWNSCYEDILHRFDGDGVLLYLDPPYLPSTVPHGGRGYRHMMDETGHAIMLERANRMERAMVAISGYRSRLYDIALKGWERHDIKTTNMVKGERTECVWLNQMAIKTKNREA
jgi:DNA adenine methylase